VAQTTIRLLHLALLYTILCYLGVEIALTLRDLREQDPRSLPAAVDPLSQSSPAGQIPFLGVTVELEQYNNPLDRQQALHRLRGAGFGWVRQRVDWGRTEPRPGAYNWTWSDQVLADIAAAGLEPVVVLDGSPLWARGSVDRTVEDEDQAANTARLAQQLQQFAPPAATKTYAAFASAFADRYKDSVRYYQIWNEPNIAPHWGNRHIDPVGYARLLKSAAIAVSAADPDAVLLAAALALDGINVYGLACDTDGIDGNGSHAGAHIDPGTLARGAERGLNARNSLDSHDSGGFFEALDDLVITGPTRTNVNDFRAFLVPARA